MRDVTVCRGRAKVLHIDVFAMKPGELVALVGPNGSGKSTLLQTLNLLQPFHGEMRLFGEVTTETNQAGLRRRCAMVFQDALLLEGTVFDNLAWPLRFRSIGAAAIRLRVYEALELFGCAHLAGRSAQQLSGGEGQRVCIARALVTNPELLLLDEPFSSLDVAMRSAMMEKIRSIAQSKGITVLMVSHNFSDVLYFAERAVALFSGRILQDDTPETLLRRPVDERVARLVGMDNILPCRIAREDGRFWVTLSGGVRFAFLGAGAVSPSFLCLPGDALLLGAEPKAKADHTGVWLEGIIERIVPGIASCCILLRSGDLLLRVRLPRERVAGQLYQGERQAVWFDAAKAHFV